MEDNNESKDPSRLLTPSEVAKILSTTSATVLRWEKSGVIPAEFRQGRIVRFVLKDVMAALSNKSKS